MFFKKNVYNLFFTLLLVFIPLKLSAYSDYIVASGENIGIRIFSDGILVVGTYDIEGKNPALDANLKVGDQITAIDNNKISSIDDMIETINKTKSDEINIEYKRNNKKVILH